MKKNGFTLIELMGVVIVMILITSVAVPSVINMKKNSEKKEYETYIKDLEIATETYMSLNRNQYPMLDLIGESVYISSDTLISEGYVNIDRMNPKTKTNISSNEKVKVTKEQDGTLSYKYFVDE